MENYDLCSHFNLLKRKNFVLESNVRWRETISCFCDICKYFPSCFLDVFTGHEKMSSNAEKNLQYCSL